MIVVKRPFSGSKFAVFHRKQIKLPVPISSEEDLIHTATRFGIKLEGELRLLEEFLMIKTREDLLAIMDKECKQIESQAEKLFDELLPVYRRMRSFYS